MLRSFWIPVIGLYLAGCTSIGSVQYLGPSRPSVNPRVDDPERCLALSGGGLRSGSVSVGLLQQLHLDEKLETVDVVASVSGGGYPIYGLVYKMSHDGVPLSNLLAENSDYLSSMERTTFVDSSELFAHVATTSLWALPDLLFGWIIRRGGMVLPSASSNLYMFNIQDTFIGEGGVRHHSLEEIDTSKLTGFPYPIFIASVHRGLRPPKKRHQYHVDDLFEFSPNWVGSPSVGYSTVGTEIDLENAIVSSGSAIDTPNRNNCVSFPGKVCSGTSPALPFRDEAGTLPRILKLFGFNTGFSIRLEEEHVYVADGGFIEGLGVLPLVRMGCEQVISLDASHDPDLVFTDLKILQYYVRELGGSMKLPSKIRNQGKRNAWEMDRHYHRFDVELGGMTSTIHYLKLGIDKREMVKYPEPVRIYAAKNWKGEYDGDGICQSPRTILEDAPTCGVLKKGVIRKACSFPQENTFRLCYEDDEFRAYRELGRHLARLLPSRVFESSQ